MHHLVAYTKTNLGTTAFTDIPAVSDDIINRLNNHFQLPEDMALVGAAALSPTLINARLTSASLRQVNYPYIRPVEVAQLPSDPPKFMPLYDTPFRLPAGEELAMEASAAPGTTEVFTGLLWLQKSFEPAPQADIIQCRLTSTTAAVANAWTTLTCTFDQSLPPGRYALVGSEVISTNAIAHRWILPGQLYRPGAMSLATATKQQHAAFQHNRLGTFGYFTNLVLPQLQVLCNGTDATHTIFAKVAKVG